MEALLEAVDPFPFVAGFVFNLPPGKDYPLRTSAAVVDPLPGTLCGPPARGLLDDTVRAWYGRIDRRRHRLIGSGGIASAEDAWRKIRLGASLLQLYTGLVYHGPGLVRRINRGLVRLPRGRRPLPCERSRGAGPSGLRRGPGRDLRRAAVRARPRPVPPMTSPHPALRLEAARDLAGRERARPRAGIRLPAGPARRAPDRRPAPGHGPRRAAGRQLRPAGGTARAPLLPQGDQQRLQPGPPVPLLPGLPGGDRAGRGPSTATTATSSA